MPGGRTATAPLARRGAGATALAVVCGGRWNESLIAWMALGMKGRSADPTLPEVRFLRDAAVDSSGFGPNARSDLEQPLEGSEGGLPLRSATADDTVPARCATAEWASAAVVEPALSVRRGALGGAPDATVGGANSASAAGGLAEPGEGIPDSDPLGGVSDDSLERWTCLFEEGGGR